MKTLQANDTAAREDERVRAAFAALGLDPEPLCPAGTGTAKQRRALLEWAHAWRACPDRRELEAKGYREPPVEPAFDPESDWARFECWMRGKPLVWNYVREFGPLAEMVDDAAVEAEIERVLQRLEERGIVLDLMDDVPARLVYDYLRRELAETAFEVTAPGTRQHMGCSDDCARCFQRAWCDLAMDDDLEDEEEEA